MIDVHHESTYKACDAMMERGGSFVKELGAAWYVADPINKGRLCMAFSHYFVQYGASDDQEVLESKYTKEELIAALKFTVEAMQYGSPEASDSLFIALRSMHGMKDIVETVQEQIANSQTKA